MDEDLILVRFIENQYYALNASYYALKQEIQAWCDKNVQCDDWVWEGSTYPTYVVFYNSLDASAFKLKFGL